MIKTKIHINDSYNNYPDIEEPKISYLKIVELDFLSELSLKISILYDTNDKNIRIGKIEADMNKKKDSKVEINIGINNSVHDGKQAARITINFSYHTIFQNEVGNSIIKLTPKGEFIQYSKTKNVSDFVVI